MLSSILIPKTSKKFIKEHYDDFNISYPLQWPFEHNPLSFLNHIVFFLKHSMVEDIIHHFGKFKDIGIILLIKILFTDMNE